MFNSFIFASSPGASSSGSSSALTHTHTRQSPIQTTKSTKPAYRSLPLPAGWTIVHEFGMKLYHHTLTGVVTDKDPCRPAAHEVIKGQFNKLVGATRRGSAELSELVFSRRASDATAAPMKMRTRTKSYQHKIKARTPLPAPAKSSRKSRTIAHVALVQKRDRICHAIHKDLRPGMVKRGLQPVYHVHYALRAQVVKGELKMSLATIEESD